MHCNWKTEFHPFGRAPQYFIPEWFKKKDGLGVRGWSYLRIKVEHDKTMFLLVEDQQVENASRICKYQ